MYYHFNRDLGEEEQNQSLDLGTYLRKRRAELGLTQEDVIRRVGSGLSLTYLRRLETGKATNPSTIMLSRLAGALELDDWTELGRYVALMHRKSLRRYEEDDRENAPILKAIDDIYERRRASKETAVRPWLNIAIRARNRDGLIADITNRVRDLQFSDGQRVKMHFFAAMETVDGSGPAGAQVIFSIDELSQEQLKQLEETLNGLDDVNVIGCFRLT